MESLKVKLKAEGKAAVSSITDVISLATKSVENSSSVHNVE